MESKSSGNENESDTSKNGDISGHQLSAQQKDQVYHQCIEMFMDVLEPNIIHDVLYQRNYDFYGALEDLMMLSSSRKSPVEQEVSSPTLETPEGDEALSEEENEIVLQKHDRKSNGAIENNFTTEVIFGSNSKSLHNIWLDAESDQMNSLALNEDKIDEGELKSIVGQYKLIKKIPNAFDRITSLIKENLKIIILLRGCPGSGKSYLALTIMRKTYIQPGKYKDHVFSTDDYFKLGKEYVFNPERLSDAHSWNQRRVLEAVRANRSPIIVDNTNTQTWEMRPYAAMAVADGYDLEILEPETWWRFHENELSKRNIHGVPKKSIRNMLERYEKNITVETLLRYCGLEYSGINVPPQLVFQSKGLNIGRKNGTKPLNKNKKVEASLSQGLPKLSNISQTSELPKKFFSSELNTNSDTLNNICTYYKSLQLDKTVNESKEIKSCSKESDTKNTDTNDRVGSLDSLSDVACGYSSVDTCNKKERKEIELCNKSTVENLIDLDFQNIQSPNKCEKDSPKNYSSFQIEAKEGSEYYKRANRSCLDQEKYFDSENKNYPEPIKSLIDELQKYVIVKDKSEENSNGTLEVNDKDLLTLSNSIVNNTLNKDDCKLPVNDNASEKYSADNNPRVNENTCRQFIMYTKQGFLYSDPVEKPETPKPEGSSLVEEERDAIISNDANLQEPTENTSVTIHSPTEVNTSTSSAFADLMLQPDIMEDIDNLLLICEEDEEESSEEEDMEIKKMCESFERITCQPESELDTPKSCISVAKEKLPEVDLMSLILKNKICEDIPDKISGIKAELPKPERLNEQERIPSIIFEYPIPTVTVAPEVASWDTVNDPLSLWQNCEKQNNRESQVSNEPTPQRVVLNESNADGTVMVDSSTNTFYADFDPIRNEFGEKILFGRNRSICEEIVAMPNKIKSGILLLDKGTMATDTGDESKIDFDELTALFPQLHGDALVELVEKCQGDLNWAVDLILDSDPVSLPAGYQSKISNNSPVQMDKSQELNKVNYNLTGARKKVAKFDKKQTLKESKLELKELIEKNIVLNESHYSDHVLKIMKRRRDGQKKDEVLNNKKLEINSNDNRNVKEEATNGKDLDIKEELMFDTGTQIVNDEGEVDNEEEEEEEQIQLAVSKELIVQLQQKFGCSLSPNILESSHVIDLPASLACQLYSYVLDSLLRETDEQQDLIEAMIKEDEEFARQLQEQEDSLERTNEKKPPMLQEIMDMEMALEFYKANQDECLQQNQNTMAAKLSMQILTQTFPNIEKALLTEMFHAHKCSLHDTVASLNLVLYEDQPNLQEREEILFSKLESVKSQEIFEDRFIVVKETECSNYPRQEALEEAENYRRQASYCYQMRTDCFMKAQEAFRSNNTSAASYYSQLAVLHKRRAEFYNSQAAASLFHARARSSTLDLHFLRVVEAKQVLDIFLDEEITRLKQNKKKKAIVFLITGRGLRSVGGVSKIKPFVQRRLRERKIIYNEVNPGMLSAILTRNTQLTNDI